MRAAPGEAVGVTVASEGKSGDGGEEGSEEDGGCDGREHGFDDRSGIDERLNFTEVRIGRGGGGRRGGKGM